MFGGRKCRSEIGLRTCFEAFARISLHSVRSSFGSFAPTRAHEKEEMRLPPNLGCALRRIQPGKRTANSSPTPPWPFPPPLSPALVRPRHLAPRAPRWAPGLGTVVVAPDARLQARRLRAGRARNLRDLKSDSEVRLSESQRSRSPLEVFWIPTPGSAEQSPRSCVSSSARGVSSILNCVFG